MGEFTSIHESAVGRPFPVVLGLNSLVGDTPGAIEALYVNTTTFEYLAAGGSVNDVLNVYSGGVEKTGGGVDYAITYDGDGRTFIDFVVSQGDNIVTFNAEGYTFAPWNSTNGYVQNPAYIVAFYLAFIVGFPGAYFDWDSFNDLADLYEDGDWEEAGRLIIQDRRTADEVLRELLFTYGAKIWFSSDGLLTIGRKDISDFANTTFVFSNIDALVYPDRREDFANYVNHANSRYDFYPASGTWMGAAEEERTKSIEDFEATRDPSPPWDFPWTTSASLVQNRMIEELLKFGYGDKNLSISLPLRWIDDLDIFSNFRFQDPFAPSPSPGAGDVGRHYYVESMAPDPLNNRLNVRAIDLQWLLRQYCILGDETPTVVPVSLTWAAASEADRMYLYLCDETTGEFADGEPCKKLADEDLLGTE